MLAAALFAGSALLAGCGGSDGTTALDPTSTTRPGMTPSSLVTNEQGVEAVVQTWMQIGFTEEQARCLVQQMEELSSADGATDGIAIGAGNENLTAELLATCKIDESLQSKLGG
jgi:hypothetical protein